VGRPAGKCLVVVCVWLVVRSELRVWMIELLGAVRGYLDEMGWSSVIFDVL